MLSSPALPRATEPPWVSVGGVVVFPFPEVAGFVGVFKMDGCAAVYPAVAAIFVAQFYGVDLNITDYLLTDPRTALRGPGGR